MNTVDLLKASGAFYCGLCSLLVLGCGEGGSARVPTVPAVPKNVWTPPTVEDIPADVAPEVRSLIEKTFSDNWAERADAAIRGRYGIRGQLLTLDA